MPRSKPFAPKWTKRKSEIAEKPAAPAMIIAAALALATVWATGNAMTDGAGATARSPGARLGSATALSSTLMSEAASRSDRPLRPAHSSHRSWALPARQLAERGLDASGEPGVRLRDLTRQAVDRHPHRPPQLGHFERSHQRAFETLLFVWRNAVHTASLRGRQAVAHAGRRDRLVADQADHVLGLPHISALDARARMQRVKPPVVQERHRCGRHDRRALNGLTEQHFEGRRHSPEARGRREGQVGQLELLVEVAVDVLDDAVHPPRVDGAAALGPPGNRGSNRYAPGR